MLTEAVIRRTDFSAKATVTATGTTAGDGAPVTVVAAAVAVAASASLLALIKVQIAVVQFTAAATKVLARPTKVAAEKLFSASVALIAVTAAREVGNSDLCGRRSLTLCSTYLSILSQHNISWFVKQGVLIHR